MGNAPFANDNAPIEVVGGTADDIANFVDETKACALDNALASVCGALRGALGLFTARGRSPASP